MLELLEGKLSRAVLRGLGGSNPVRLPGGWLGNRRLYPETDGPQRTLCGRACVSACGPPLTATVRLSEGGITHACSGFKTYKGPR